MRDGAQISEAPQVAGRPATDDRGGSTVGDAGSAVDYENQSQTGRERRRLFRAPPRQDIERLRKA